MMCAISPLLGIDVKVTYPTRCRFPGRWWRELDRNLYWREVEREAA